MTTSQRLSPDAEPVIERIDRDLLARVIQTDTYSLERAGQTHKLTASDLLSPVKLTQLLNETRSPGEVELKPQLRPDDHIKVINTFLEFNEHSLPAADEQAYLYADAIIADVARKRARRHEHILDWFDVSRLQHDLIAAEAAAHTGIRNEHDDPDVDPSYFNGIVARILLTGVPVYVSRDVLAILDVAYPDFQPEVFAQSDPFVEAGFAAFEHPIHLHADHPDGDAEMPVAALGWAPVTFEGETKTGVGFALWPPVGHTDSSGRYSVAVRSFGAGWRPSDSPINRFVQAFWRLGQQFVLAEERLPRAERRRAERRNRPVESVTIMRLRRAKHPTASGDHVPVDWTHRWIVRGHWRNQWYPSEQRHRQRYVIPHVKGPDDKPLHVTRKVVEFIR